jgi:hypothetical protein
MGTFITATAGPCRRNRAIFCRTRVALPPQPARRPVAHEHQQGSPGHRQPGRFKPWRKCRVARVKMSAPWPPAVRRKPSGNSAFRKRSASCTTLSATHSGTSSVSRSNPAGSDARHARNSRRNVAGRRCRAAPLFRPSRWATNGRFGPRGNAALPGIYAAPSTRAIASGCEFVEFIHRPFL